MFQLVIDVLCKKQAITCFHNPPCNSRKSYAVRRVRTNEYGALARSSEFLRVIFIEETRTDASNETNRPN